MQVPLVELIDKPNIMSPHQNLQTKENDVKRKVRLPNKIEQFGINLVLSSGIRLCNEMPIVALNSK